MPLRSHRVLAIQYGGHDTAAALMIDGRLIAACEQERFSLDKHSRRFPIDAIQACLKAGALKIDDLDEFALAHDPLFMIRELYLRPAMESYDRIRFMLNDAERIKKSLDFENIIRTETGFKGKVTTYRHHICHVASSYYPSGFQNALLVSYDGIGEIESAIIGTGRSGSITVHHDGNRYPNSLGLLYSAMTFYLGWLHHCDEGIIMGLAPYGDSSRKVPGHSRTYIDFFREILRETGPYSFEINLDWIAYHRVRDTWISGKFKDVFGPPRAHGTEITDHHRNIAAALQDRLEEVVLAQMRAARKEFGLPRLCLAGGVALNCSMNGKIAAAGIFDEIFVQPASGDAGVAIGACYLASAQHQDGLAPARNHNFYLGSQFTDTDIDNALAASKISYRRSADIFTDTAQLLADGKVVAWFNGAAEFGPRALGNRSILTRPFPAEMKDHLNARVKHREAFRPFAPAVLAERAQEYFHVTQESPHMLMAVGTREVKRDKIPAVVHVDGSARVQTVKPENNGRFYRLLQAFDAITGVPVLLNTSFNVKGQPVINTPEQAIACFLGTQIDVLVMSDFIAVKE